MTAITVFCFPSLVVFVGCLTAKQHAHVFYRLVCSDNCMCCHTETDIAHQTCHLTQSQYTDTWPTSLSADPVNTGSMTGEATRVPNSWFDLIGDNRVLLLMCSQLYLWALPFCARFLHVTVFNPNIEVVTFRLHE